MAARDALPRKAQVLWTANVHAARSHDAIETARTPSGGARSFTGYATMGSLLAASLGSGWDWEQAVVDLHAHLRMHPCRSRDLLRRRLVRYAPPQRSRSDPRRSRGAGTLSTLISILAGFPGTPENVHRRGDVPTPEASRRDLYPAAAAAVVQLLAVFSGVAAAAEPF